MDHGRTRGGDDHGDPASWRVSGTNGGGMAHRAAESSLWETAWRTQPVGGPAILGGDYDPDVLEAAYRHGYFPMVQDRPWQRGFRQRVPRPRIPVLPGSVNPY